MDVKDTLLEMYRLNYDYHNAKEQLYWLIGSLYLGFSAGAIARTTSNTEIVHKYRMLIALFSFAVLLFSEVMVGVQNWCKSRSVFIDGLLPDLLRRFDSGMKRPKYWEICGAVQSDRTHPKYDFWKIFCANGIFGIVAMSIMLVFGLAQIILAVIV